MQKPLVLAVFVSLHLGTVSQAEVTWHWQEVKECSPVITSLRRIPQHDDMRISQQDGLPFSLITAIRQLQDGAMVFGGRDGLSIWRKDVLEIWGTSSLARCGGEGVPGGSRLPIGGVTDLLVTGDGSLWVASDRGLCRLRNGRWWSLKGEAPRPEGWPEYSNLADELLDIFVIRETSRGEVVFGSRCAGVTVVDPTSGRAETITHNTEVNNWVTGIAEDERQNLWIGIIELGVWCYDGKHFTHYTEDEPWVPQNRVRSLAIDHSGRLWVGTHKGLGVRRPDGSAEWFTQSDVLPNNHVWHIWPLRNGQVWVHTSDGMAVFDGAAWSYPDSKGMMAVASCPYTGFFEEDTGALWFGGWDGAVRNPKYLMTTHNPVATQLAEWKEQVQRSWPKTERSPLCAVDRLKRVYGHKGHKLLRYDGTTWEDLSGAVGDNPINFIRADSKGRVWVGTSGTGLIGYDGDAVLRFNADATGGASVLYDMAEDSQGVLYFATQGGLFRFAGGEWGQVPNVPSSQIGRVLVDQHDRVWYLDTLFGLLCMWDGGSPHYMSDRGALRGRRIRSLSLTPDGRFRVDTVSSTLGAEDCQAFVFEEGQFVPYRPMPLVVLVFGAVGLVALVAAVVLGVTRAHARRKRKPQGATRP